MSSSELLTDVKKPSPKDNQPEVRNRKKSHESNKSVKSKNSSSEKEKQSQIPFIPERELQTDFSLSFKEIYNIHMEEIESKTNLKRKHIYYFLAISLFFFLIGYFELVFSYIITGYYPLKFTIQDYKANKENFGKKWGTYWFVFVSFIFLDLHKNAPEIIGNNPKEIYNYHKLPLGVRNFIVIPNKEIMLVCCSEMNIISRADLMLSNLSFPWDKKKDGQIPLGAAFIYQCKPDEKEIYIIHKIWAQSFEYQTGAIFWEDRNEIYCIGNDDGKIYSYKAQPKTHYMVMNKISELNFHKNRVMGLALDPRTMNLFSCSTDKTFYITDLNGGNYAKSLVKNNESGYTNLEFIQENN